MWETMLYGEWAFRIFGFIAFLVLCVCGAVALIVWVIYAAAGAVYGEISEEGKENHAAQEASQGSDRVPPGEGR